MKLKMYGRTHNKSQSFPFNKLGLFLLAGALGLGQPGSAQTASEGSNGNSEMSLSEFISPEARAGASKNWDYSLTAGARNFPLGGGVGGQMGYSQLLWGKASEGNVIYGYVRPALGATTSGSVNRANVKVEVSPIAPLVLSTGYQLLFTNSEIDTIDCKTVSCSHYMTKQINSASLVFGVLPWFAKVEVSQENHTASVNGVPFVDPESTLVGQATGKDKLNSMDFSTGIIVNDKWTAGVQLSKNEFLESKTKNDVQSVFVKNKLADFSWIAGAGTFESSFARRQAFGFAAVEITYGKSLGL